MKIRNFNYYTRKKLALRYVKLLCIKTVFKIKF